MHDHHVSYIVQLFGHVLSSHIMARASLSGGIGRAEETLSADLRDLASQYDVATDYLTHLGSRSWIKFGVHDISKPVEARIGADFVVVIQGHDTDGTNMRTIRKVVLLQAKRLDFAHAAALRYARSTNHRAHAKHMAIAGGLPNAFFAFYHSDAIQPAVPYVPAWPLPMSGPPTFFFLSPQQGEHYFMGHHPQMGRPAFIEPSAYRSLYMRRMNPASWSLPPYFGWGIGVLSADYFVTAAGRARPRRRDLPSVDHVLANGWAFESFLVALADCVEGTNYDTDREFIDAIQIARAGTAWFNPSFMLSVNFSSNTSQRNVEWAPRDLTFDNED